MNGNDKNAVDKKEFPGSTFHRIVTYGWPRVNDTMERKLVFNVGTALR